MNRSSVSCSFRRRAAFTGLAAAMVLTTSPAAFADRPGTPNNESARPCYLPRVSKPKVCVIFANTASEAVTFDVEMTANGAAVPVASRPKADCIADSINYEKKATCTGCNPAWNANTTDCQVASHFNTPGRGPKAEGRTGEWVKGARTPILNQGFLLRDLEYDSTYCFRIRARRASDDMVSERWTNWACATTNPVPPPAPKPVAPKNLSVNYTRGGKDWRTKPPKVALKWQTQWLTDFDGQRLEYPVTIEKTLGGKSVQLNLKLSNAKTSLAELGAAEDVLTEADFPGATNVPPVAYRVCSSNQAQKVCSAVIAVVDTVRGAETDKDIDVLSKEPNAKIDPGRGDVVKKPTSLFKKRPRGDPISGGSGDPR